MTSSKVREFYWRFYKKRTASFISNLYKASITGSEKDIHRTRVDMKRINAILEMFEMLNPEKFSQESFDVFRELFSFSGKIRELQVNQMVILRYGPETKGRALFIRYLRARENKLSKQFMGIVQDFDEKKLKKSERSLKKLCREIKISTLKARTEKFILKKGKRIKLLRNYPSNPEHIHEIRKHLKAMVTILSLVSLVFRDDKQKAILEGLTQTEILIGNWHDNQVLMEDIERFLHKRNTLDKEYQLHLQLLRIKILKSNSELLNSLFPEMEYVLTLIFPTPLPDESNQGNI